MVEGAFEQKVGDDVTVSSRQFVMKRGDRVVAEVRPEASAACAPVSPYYPSAVALPQPGMRYEYDPRFGAVRAIYGADAARAESTEPPIAFLADPVRDEDETPAESVLKAKSDEDL